MLKRFWCKGCFFVGLLMPVLLSGCGSSPSDRENVPQTEVAEAVTPQTEKPGAEEPSTEPPAEEPSTEELLEEGSSAKQEDAAVEFELTGEGKEFLERMCRELEDFDSPAAMDEEFWRNFLFFSYTGSFSETEQIYREDMGCEETVVKVSLQEAEAHARLVFGVELPDIKPSFEDMEEGQTACYYEDGYYYIGVSDFPDCGYVFAECVADRESGCVAVTYTIEFEEESNAGTVSFTIEPEENENGFVIRSKATELY